MILYVRFGCHLCEEALEQLALIGLLPVTIIDIDDDDELGANYGLRIPVLRNDQGLELDWPFDEIALSDFAAS
jgi:Glutaredoxin-like domain (DUF836)